MNQRLYCVVFYAGGSASGQDEIEYDLQQEECCPRR